MVKLTRTLSIIPTVLVFTFINMRIKRKENATYSSKKVNIMSLFPWFIAGFLALAVLNSIGLIPAHVSSAAKDISKFLMVSALAAIGLNTSFKDVKKSGLNPMIHGFIISALVVVVAIGVEWCMGLV